MTSWKDVALDCKAQAEELTRKVRDLESTVEQEHAAMLKERSEKYALKMKLTAANEKLKRRRDEVMPALVGEGEYECPDPTCCCALVEDWEFCPSCGASLDWESVGTPDWYAEESEAFYREQQVSAPLGVVPL